MFKPLQLQPEEAEVRLGEEEVEVEAEVISNLLTEVEAVVEAPRTRVLNPVEEEVPHEDLAVWVRLLHFSKNWEDISTDPWILKTVTEGYKIEFTGPCQLQNPNGHMFLRTETNFRS